LLVLVSFASAADFTPGNVVVVRVGNGVTALSSAAAPVFLDEYNRSGTLVQSVALPTADSGSNSKFALSGGNDTGKTGAGAEGPLALSTDRRFVTLAGYAAAPGDASSTYRFATAALSNRVVARVDVHGAIDTTTRINDAFNGDSVRAAITTDGSAFWIGGISSDSTGGVHYAPLGNTGASVKVAGISGVRTLGIFSNQLFSTFGTATIDTGGIAKIGAGLPTTAATSTNLVGLTLDKPGGFVMFTPAAGQFVVYIADQTHGLLKYYSLDGVTWIAQGSIAGSLVGLTGVQSLDGIVLFATIGTGSADTLATVIDTAPYNQQLTGAFTTLTIAPPNTSFRSVAFTPGTTLVALDSPATATPSTAGRNEPVTFSAQASGGTKTLTYSWTFGDGATGSGATTTHAYAAAGTYSVSLTITDGLTGVASGTTVTVVEPTAGQGNDSDGDGFSDAEEIAAGTNPNDASSTPFGGLPAPETETLSMLTKSVKLNFKKPVGNDSVALSGVVPAPPGTTFDKQLFLIDAGGVIQAFTLDAKGKATATNAKVTLSNPAKTNVTVFKVTLTKGTFAATLEPIGFVNQTITTPVVLKVPITVLFNKRVFSNPQSKFLYKAKQGASGSATKG
jgi:hypothetical protein